jgi:homoserine kinase
MSAQVDYLDGRDWLTGERKTLLTPPEFLIESDQEMNDVLAEHAEAMLVAEVRIERHRDAVLSAAIGALREIIEEAEQGFYPERAIRAAAADLIIPHLGAQLRAARALIPADADPQALLRIDTALAAAGLAPT